MMIESQTGLLAAAASLIVCWLVRTIFVLHRRTKPIQPNDAGVATIEFALVMPIVLFLILVLVQTTLLMAGRSIVDYSAFAATRAAIVQIPRDFTEDGEPRLTIYTEPDSRKFDAIRRAAWFAVMPVSGRDDTAELNPEAFAEGLREYFELQGQTPPRWVDTLASERLGYAAQHTEVELQVPVITGNDVTFENVTSPLHTFAPKDPLAVRVRHRFNLSVPYVRAIFADDYQQTKHGRTAYTTITAHAMLHLEGIDPALPDEPRLPRRDR